MHRLTAVTAACLLLILAVAPAHAAEGTKYGKGLSGPDVVAISDLMASPDKYVGKTVRVEGLIADVCPKRGCWMDLAGDKEFETLRIKVEDGEIVFPLDAKGKRATAEGVFTKMEITKDQAIERAKHHAEEKGEAFDAAKAKDLPTVIYQINGTGAVIR